MRRDLALFSFGFRPFFLFAAVWSALAVPLWVGAMLAGEGTIGGAAGRDWHVHEMLFGYLGAVVAGFLLTATPNWTGRAPITGRPLAALFALWLTARLLGLAPEGLAFAAGAVDIAFFVVFAALIWREVLAGKNRRNLPICVAVTVLALADIAFHLQEGSAPVAERTALAVAAGLIALIGGRIVPSFTQNWLSQRNDPARPTAFNAADGVVLGLTVLALVAWVAAGAAGWTGLLLMAAGVANLVRLARWRGWRAGAEALVWILHLGYGWLAMGLLLLGAALAFPERVPLTAGVHALTAGAIGTMTLAVMTRASLGHTGRPRIADRWTIGLYLAVTAAALTRVAAPFVPAHYPLLLGVSAALWSAAFATFALRYAPMLLLPRRPG